MNETSTKASAGDEAEPERAQAEGTGAAPSGGAAPERKPGRVQQLLVEYGVIGIVVLLSLSALTYAGFAVAFLVGFEVEGAGETAGVLGAAGVGWALTKPIRIPLAIALTPVVAAIWHRIRGKRPPAAG
jgi:hypothetical protein